MKNLAYLLISFLSACFCIPSAFSASIEDASSITPPPAQILTDWMRQDSGLLDVTHILKEENDETHELRQRMIQKVTADILKLIGVTRDELLADTNPKSRQLLSELLELEALSLSSSRERRPWLDTYQSCCLKRRELRLKTFREEYPVWVFTKHFNICGSHYAYTEAQSDAQAERNYAPGSALCVLEWANETRSQFRQRVLLEDKHGVIRDPVVTFDGQKIIFAWKRSDRLDDYHLYEYTLETGTVRQLTFGTGVADYEPCVLPDGDIIFNSTRCVQIVDCWWTEVSNLYRCDKDGNYLRRVSFDQVHTNYPTILADGRIIYTRWDYNDRGQIFPQGLFQMNWDGTAQTECYGNNSWFPTTIMHTRGIPNSQKLIAVLSGHHNDQRGKLAVIDTSLGRQENQGVQLIAPVRKTTADRVDAWGQEGEQFQYPYALNETEFVVTYHPDLGGDRVYRGPLGIFYMDIDGNRELLAYDDRISCNQPFPLRKREAIPMRPSTVDENTDFGTYYVQDVFFGPGLEGVERSRAKKLRVTALEFRHTGIGSNGNHGPGGGAMVSTPISISHGTWDVKIPLGDATIYEDGSACFHAPAKTPLYFQVLDENGHAIQSMRSWSTLQPGETFSCLGCHEDKNTGTMFRPGTTEAMRQGPQKLIPFYGPPRGFSFEKEIQPILDRHCVSCHHDSQKSAPSAENRKADFAAKDPVFSLRGEKILDGQAKRLWSLSYLNLTGARKNFEGRHTDVVRWINVQEAPPMLSPYKSGAAKSRLPFMFLGDETHQDVKLSQEENDKIAIWIDLLVPYCGDYTENAAWPDDEKQKYAYYETKKRNLEARDRENNQNWRKHLETAETVINPDVTDPIRTNSYRDLTREAEISAEGDTVWKADFGKQVHTDRIVVTLKKDLPKDMKLTRLVFHFSSGDPHTIHFADTDTPATVFSLPRDTREIKVLAAWPEERAMWEMVDRVEIFGITRPEFCETPDCWRPY